MRVNLETLDDALYVGSLYLGAPHGQKARVIFDTGSEHLAITGSLCNNQTAGPYHFYQDSKYSKTLTIEKLELPPEEKNTTNLDQKSQKDDDELIQL